MQDKIMNTQGLTNEFSPVVPQNYEFTKGINLTISSTPYENCPILYNIVMYSYARNIQCKY